jgi:hypothetical protein
LCGLHLPCDLCDFCSSDGKRRSSRLQASQTRALDDWLTERQRLFDEKQSLWGEQ